MDSPSETSFVRQSLTDTLTATARPSKAPLRSLHTNSTGPAPPPTVSKHRASSSLSTATKKPRPVNVTGDDEADGLLRRLGLATADGSTMEDASFSAAARHPGLSPSEAFATPRPRKLPSGPADFLPPGQKDGEVEKERDAFRERCRVLEEELKLALEAREGPGEKVLGAKEYEELERQFDAQEKVLLLPLKLDAELTTSSC